MTLFAIGVALSIGTLVTNLVVGSLGERRIPGSNDTVVFRFCIPG